MTKFSAPQQNQLAQIGAFLRDNREKQNKSLEDIAIRTYIRPQLLKGIESGDPDALPEPIFVQGFIRRYGEALGLNGIELSQQFTVTSIPSTPRPSRPTPPADSTTTRFTRVDKSHSPTTAANRSAAATPMFSAGGIADAQPARNIAQNTSRDISGDLTLGRPDPLTETAASFDPNFVADAPLETAPIGDSFENSPFTSGSFDDIASKAFDSTVDDIAGVDNIEGIDDTTADFNAADPLIDDTTLTSQTIGVEPEADVEDDFASKIAAFDKANLNQPRFDLPDESTALNSSADLENPPSNPGFDDDLPAAFTTQTQPQAQPQTLSEPESWHSQTRLESTDSTPIGLDYDRPTQPSLKPFIIGGVVAAIAAAALILATLFGGGNRQPSVVNNADTTEKAEENAAAQAPPPPKPAEPVAPPISTAPVYVEATATSDAWVSIIVDGNPKPIFEGTLKPGEKKLWEGQKSINVYSGDAGALKLAANGGEATVMGAPGQPEEKIFPQ